MTWARSAAILRAVTRNRRDMQLGLTSSSRLQPGQFGARPISSMKYCGVPAVAPSDTVALTQLLNAGSSQRSGTPAAGAGCAHKPAARSEEHTSELQSLMRH